MTESTSIDRAAVLHGLRTGLLLVVPAGVFTAALTDDLPELVRALFVVVILAGFTTAGAQAARAATIAAMPSAAVASALTYGAVQLPLSIVRLGRGESLNVWTYIFLALTAMSCGVIGALVALRSVRRAEERAERAASSGDDDDSGGPAAAGWAARG